MRGLELIDRVRAIAERKELDAVIEEACCHGRASAKSAALRCEALDLEATADLLELLMEDL